MADRYHHTGKQLFRGDKHVCDAVNEAEAAKAVAVFNRGATDWDDEDVVQLIGEAMSEAQDIDVDIYQLARAGFDALRKEGLL